MINNGCGLCVELAHNVRTNKSLWVRCKQDGEDVKVLSAHDPAAFHYVVATPDTDTSWSWGHYFIDLKDAVEYLYSE